MVTAMYWALFALAIIGLFGSVLAIFSGKLGWLVVCVGIMFPYGAMWVIDYGSNCMIRTEITVAAKVSSQNDVPEGRRAVIQLTPQPHMFYGEPSEPRFSVFGAIDDRPVKVVSMTVERGLDRLITAVTIEIFVPNVGASSVRLDNISFGNRSYIVKSGVLELGHHYAYE